MTDFLSWYHQKQAYSLISFKKKSVLCLLKHPRSRSLMEHSQCDGANRWNDELETARSGSAQCIPLLRVPLRSQQPPSSSRLPSTLTRLRAPYLVHGNSARVHGSLAMARRRSWRKKEEEKNVETKKKDQRRTDRARINCHNTGSSLSTSATYVFSSLGKCVECYNESSLF